METGAVNVAEVWTQMMRVLVVILGLAAAMPAHAVYNPVPCKNAFTEEQERVEGQKLADEIYKQMPVLRENDPLTKYVQSIGNRLAVLAPGYAWPYSFHVVSSAEINAFALPGGAVFINLGTIQAAETEAQLAGVIAHEVSHVAMRHATCNLTKQRSRRLLAGLAQIGGALAGGWGQVAGNGVSGAIGLSFLKNSREAEQQADLVGVDVMYDAGWDPRGMPQFFEIIQSKYGDGGSSLFADHPNPGNRSGYTNAEIQTLPVRKDWIKTSAAFVEGKKRAGQLKPLTAEQVKLGTWRQESGAFQTSAPPAAPPIRRD